MMIAIVYDRRKGWLLPRYFDSNQALARGVET